MRKVVLFVKDAVDIIWFFRVPLGVGAVVAVVMLTAEYAIIHAQDQSPAQPKFLLSRDEGLQLENLQLRRDVLNRDIQLYILTTLKSHGDISGIVFDWNAMTWQVQQLPPHVEPAK